MRRNRRRSRLRAVSGSQIPEALEQTVGTIEWLHAHGGELGIDSTRLAVGGDSGGKPGRRCRAQAARRRQGRVAARHPPELRRGHSECSPGAVEQDGGDACHRRGDAPVLGQLSCERRSGPRSLCLPVAGDLRGLPPVFLGISECDVLAEQNLAFAGALRAAGVETEAVLSGRDAQLSRSGIDRTRGRARIAGELGMAAAQAVVIAAGATGGPGLFAMKSDPSASAGARTQSAISRIPPDPH